MRRVDLLLSLLFFGIECKRKLYNPSFGPFDNNKIGIHSVIPGAFEDQLEKQRRPISFQNRQRMVDSLMSISKYPIKKSLQNLAKSKLYLKIPFGYGQRACNS